MRRERSISLSACPPESPERSFVRRCWELATLGLPEEQSTTWATYELGKWLDGVECYYLPSEIRAQKVDSPLWSFIEERHNGCCSRLAEGRYEAVHLQITRLIAKAEKTVEEPCFQKPRHAYRQGCGNSLVVEYILT
jgi:hypothetical protein